MKIPDKVSECAVTVTGPVCTDEPVVAAIGKSLGIEETNAVDVIAAAKEKLDCPTEECVVKASVATLGQRVVDAQIANNFKLPGPTDDALLSNVNIDDTMAQWARAFPDFYAFNFNMRDYARYSFKDGRVLDRPDSLATVQFKDLYSGEFGPKYRRCACVINTDNYEGPGKHWMALFADTTGPVWTVEFFNSSGNAPLPEYQRWLEKTALQMETLATTSIRIINNSGIRHQNSKTECGVYSLFYIFSRLKGTSPEFFASGKVADRDMFHFRQHLFRNEIQSAYVQNSTFDWDAYQKNVRIKWE